MSTREDRDEDARQDAIWDDQHPEDLVCPSCGGDGEVRMFWEELRWKKCEDCDGSGQIDPDDYDLPYSETL